MATTETVELIDTQLLSDILNKNIDLSTYGNGLRRIYFTFQAIDPETHQLENELDFDSNLKHLHISLSLSYQHLLNASSKTIQEMMARLFIVAIDLYEKAGIIDFDQDRFKKVVKTLLVDKEWLPLEANKE